MIQRTVTKQMKIETEKIERMIKETILEQRERNPFREGRSVRFNEDILANEMNRNEYENTEQNEQNIQFDEQLIPTKQTNDNHSESKLYEIYVSKFACNILAESIEQHITRNTEHSTNTFKIEEIKSNNNSGRAPNYKAFKITTLKRNIYNDIMNIWEPHYKARDFIPTTIERGQTATNTRYEYTTNTHNRTPNRTYIRPNDTGYNAQRQNKQFTPKRNMSYNRNEQNRTTTNNGFERNVTPERHNYNTERRQTGRQYNNRQSEQQNIQQTNRQSSFLDTNTQSQQYQQGAGNKYRQGVNSQQQQGRVQYETRPQHQNPFR